MRLLTPSFGHNREHWMGNHNPEFSMPVSWTLDASLWFSEPQFPYSNADQPSALCRSVCDTLVIVGAHKQSHRRRKRRGGEWSVGLHRHHERAAGDLLAPHSAPPV